MHTDRGNADTLDRDNADTVQKIPRWTSFSEYEQCRFLNQIFDQIWPFAKEPAEKVIKDTMSELFRDIVKELGR
jgi:hypothetical protein